MLADIHQVRRHLPGGAPQHGCKGSTASSIQAFSGEVGFQLTGVAAPSIGRANDPSKRHLGTGSVRKYIDGTPCASQPCF